LIPKEVEVTILRLHAVEKWPPGTIARQLALHHDVVDRVLRDAGVPEEELARRPSVVDPFVPFILETLEKYPHLCASRLFEMVRERGYPGRPDHFRAIVRRYRPRKPAEAFLRLRTLPGEQAQVDWARFGSLDVGRARRPLFAFVMVLSFSRHIFLVFSFDARMGSFLRGHLAAFEAFGGVPRVLLYDNLKSAVIERVGDAIRFHDTLLEFAAWHRYEPRPVAPYRGNEKGRVERAIRYVRDAFFPARTFADLDDLNAQARAWCEGLAADRRCPEDRSRTVRDAFAEERPLLLPLPDDRYPAWDRLEVSVGKTPYVRFDGNDYSVPHDRVRRALVVLADQGSVRVLDGHEEIARHDRCWSRGEQIEDQAHIQALVARKREAREGRGLDRLAHAAPSSRLLFRALAERGQNLGAATNGLLRLLDSHGAESLEAAVSEVLQAETPHLSAIHQALDRRSHERGQPPPVPVDLPDDPRVRGLVVHPHALSTYDHLARKPR
jgi:transposase